LLERHAGVLGQRVRRVLAADPGLAPGHVGLGVGAQSLLQQAKALRRDVRGRARVLGRLDRDRAVRVVEGMGFDRRDLAHELERRLLQPQRVERGLEGEPQQCIGVAPGDRAHDLLDQGPGEGLGADQHLPARLHVDAVLDQEPRVLDQPCLGAQEPGSCRRDT